jgi:hypothetical protein
MNLKNEFSKWFSPKAPESYRNWFRKNLDEKLNDINDKYNSSFKKSLFDIDINNLQEEISIIKNNLKNKNDVEDKTFTEYNDKNQNGIPNAIINKFYIRFLEIYGTDGGGSDESVIEGEKAVTYFSYEKDLQNSLISQAEELFPEYKIFGNNGEGIEYNINGKRIDLLLEHKTENKLLVIELKAGLADYKVYGQISMYMGPLMKKTGKDVSGRIIAGEIDESLKMAILASEKVKTMTYKMKLTLEEIV